MQECLIVGAGLAGAVVAERLAASGVTSLVVDARATIGGNCYDELELDGSYFHKYGPHIFHTNNDEVWEYVNKFTSFNSYKHFAVSKIGDKFIHLPLNLNSLFLLTGDLYLENTLMTEFKQGQRIPIGKLLKHENKRVAERCKEVFEQVFANYTRKQWGTSDVPESVMSRVPVVLDFQSFYFDDKHQGMPVSGYTTMVEMLLSSPSIHVTLREKCTLDTIRRFDGPVVYTGAIDYLFDLELGRLPYRGLTFTTREVLSNQQSCAQVNYPGHEPFTRSTEGSHFYRENGAHRVSFEHPVQATTEELCFYPMESDLSKRYTEKLPPHVIPVGRLAEFKYLNMDQVILSALHASSMILERSLVQSHSKL